MSGLIQSLPNGGLKEVPLVTSAISLAGDIRLPPKSLFAFSNEYNIPTEFYDTEVSGGGSVTHVNTASRIDLVVGTSSGDLAQTTTRIYFPYTASFPRGTENTISISQMGNGAKVEFGSFDDENGLFWRIIKDQTSGKLKISVVVRRTINGQATEEIVANAEGVVTPIPPFSTSPQPIKNSGDNLDGTGDSKYDINRTADKLYGNLFFIRNLWLGVGGAEFGIKTTFGGEISFHKFDNENKNEDVYNRTPNLPIRYRVENTSVSDKSTIVKQICSSSLTYGGKDISEISGYPIMLRRVNISITDSSNFTPLLSLRLLQNFNGVKNRSIVVPKFISVAVNDIDPVEIAIIKNGTVSGGSYLSSNIQSETCCALNLSPSTVVGGYVVYGELVSRYAGNAIPLDKNSVYTRSADNSSSDEFTVVGRDIVGNTNVSIYVSCIEIR